MRRELRLKKPQDFGKAFKEGRRIASPHFALYVRKNNLAEARLGVSILKSHFKLATRRNKLRRTAKALFQKEITPGFKGNDFVLTSRKGCQDGDFNKALRELKDFLTRVKG